MTDTSNADQIEFWNGPAGQRWAKHQENMDRNMRAITAALLPFAAPQPGERVLDLGCGSGTTTLLLAEAVGAGGNATGIDISVPMLALARTRAAGQWSNVEFIEADASAFAFEAMYDLVFSRFGVMFFDEPVAAFRNIRRALKPEGRMVFVCWRQPSENPWALVPLEAARPLLPEQPPVDPYAPGPFAFAEKPRLEGILADAGFRGIEIEAFDGPMNIGDSLEDASAMMLEIGPLSRAAAQLDDDVRAQIRKAVEAALVKFATPSGVTPPGACWLVRATG